MVGCFRPAESPASALLWLSSLLSVHLPLANATAGDSLRRAGGSLSRVLERISSGVRVVSARDDAAGLGVATDLRTEQKSERMALRNIHDAMELVNTAEGGLVETVDILQRMRELAVASASETLANEERQYLQDEYGQLLDEIDRLVNSTEFGGRRLLGPDPVDMVFMIDLSDSMGFEIPSFRNEIPAFRQTLQDAGIDVRMGLVGVSNSSDTVDGSTVYISLTSDEQAFDSVLSTFTNTGLGLMDPYTTMLDQAGIAPIDGDNPDEHNFRPNARKMLMYASDQGQETSLSAATEASAAADLAAAGFEVHAMIRTFSDLADFDDIVAATGGSAVNMPASGANFDIMLDTIAQSIIGSSRPLSTLEVQADTGSGAEDRIPLNFPVDVTAYGLGITSTGVATVADARASIAALDDALAIVGEASSTLGATWNRLNSAADHHEVRLNALAQGESTIRDADFALETSELAVAQILQQASIAAMAQARGIQAAAIPALLS